MARRGRVEAPKLSLVFTPREGETRVVLFMDGGIVGSASGVPTGRIGIRLGASDLVGLTPARAALKAVSALQRSLAHIVSTQDAGASSGAPLGATGGTVWTQLALQYTDASARELVAL